MKKCQNCDARMNDLDNYCSICGVSKKGGVFLCPVCKHAVDLTKMEFCSNCGEYLIKGKTKVTNIYRE